MEYTHIRISKKHKEMLKYIADYDNDSVLACLHKLIESDFQAVKEADVNIVRNDVNIPNFSDVNTVVSGLSDNVNIYCDGVRVM